jgi:C4-dicarboxylate transporter DctM subunit
VGIIRLTVGDTAAVMLIVACSSVFAWVITIDGTVVSWVADFASSATAHWQVFLMAGVVLLVAGLFLDGASIYLVIIPLLMPAVRALGIDLVWFGIFVAIAIGAGQFTPPVGVNLFVASRVLGVSLERVVGETGPFLLAALVGLVLVYLFPALSTWLPSMMP